MGLHFYYGGTLGAADGTLISSGDLTSPLIFDGMYPGSSTSSVAKTLFLRADAGEIWRDVNIILREFTTTSHFSLSAPSKGFIGGYTASDKSIFWIPKVTDVNISMTLTASSTSTETSGSPDTSAYIIAFGRLT